MTNLVCASRSNYFRVKDKAAFLTWVDQVGMTLHQSEDGRFAMFGDDEGFWPSHRYEGDDEIEIEIAKEVPRHLADGEVAVLMQAGFEGNRSIVGWAIAIHSDGRTVEVTLGDIYAAAEAEFGFAPNGVE